MKYYIGNSDMYGFTHYLYGEAYLGSYKGKRFRLGREPLENVFFKSDEERGKDAFFLASVWDEPWSWEKKDVETLIEERFPFSEDGLGEAVNWLKEKCGCP